MTSKPTTLTTSSITAEWECSKLRQFKDFLQQYSKDSATAANGADTRNCMTRTTNETYPVSRQELRAEVQLCLWNHLSSKRCPDHFKLPLLRAVVDAVENERKTSKVCDFTCTGLTADEKPEEQHYDLIKLQKFTLNHLEKLLTRLADNAEACALQKFVAQTTHCDSADSHCHCEEADQTRCVALVAAVKNKPRKMEDRHCCWSRYSEAFQIKNNASMDYSFYAVFDGHSGPLAAAYAAAQLPQLCAQRLQQQSTADGVAERMAALKFAFMETDKMFARKHISSGTTAVCALHCTPSSGGTAQLLVAWVGDSRAMLVSRSTRRQLVHPHKPDDATERQRIEEEGGAVMFVQGQWRVNGILNVSRSIGDFSVSSVIAVPDVVCVDISAADDFLVLGTDGLWDHASEQDIVATIYTGLAKADMALEELPKLLLDLAKRGDSQDNITAIIILLRERARIVDELESGREKQ